MINTIRGLQAIAKRNRQMLTFAKADWTGTSLDSAMKNVIVADEDYNNIEQYSLMEFNIGRLLHQLLHIKNLLSCNNFLELDQQLKNPTLHTLKFSHFEINFLAQRERILIASYDKDKKWEQIQSVIYGDNTDLDMEQLNVELITIEDKLRIILETDVSDPSSLQRLRYILE